MLGRVRRSTMSSPEQLELERPSKLIKADSLSIYEQMEREEPKGHCGVLMPILQVELITEILLWLSAKILLKFRCVSKYWMAVISSSQFVKDYLSLSINNKENTRQGLFLTSIQPRVIHKICSVPSLLYHSVMEASDLDCPSRPRFYALGCVNGLICLIARTSARARGRSFFLWNPSIRKFNEITDSKSALRCIREMFGFGYDELHDDYKLVCIYYTTTNVKTEVYSLNRGSWRRLDDCQGVSLYTSSARLVNGKLHWVGGGDYPGRGGTRGDIIYFDLANEKWGKLERPFEVSSGKLGVLGSKLCIFHPDKETCAHLWVMKEYGLKDSWTIVYTIKFSHDISCVWNPLFCKSSIGEVLLVFGTRFIIYCPKDDSVRYLDDSRFDKYSVLDFYIDSIVSPFPKR